MLERIMEYVNQKLANSYKKDLLLVAAESAKPWEACCPQSYTEDIWTPEHFKTNVADWFLISQDEQLLCTCEQNSETIFDDVCSTETNSICHRDSISDSRNETNDYQNFKLPEQCGVDVNNDYDTQRCDDRNAQWPSANTKKFDTNIRSCCSAAIYPKVGGFDLRQADVEDTCYEETDYKKNNMPDTHKIPFKNNDTHTTICREEHDLPDVQESKVVKKPSNGICTCPNNSTSLLQNTSESQEACGIKYGNGYLYCENETEPNEQRQCDLKNVIGKSKLDEPTIKTCSGGIFHSCRPKNMQKCSTMRTTASGYEGSSISSKSENSSTTKCRDTCYLKDNAVYVMASSSPSHSSSLLSECRTISERKESDHRLDYRPDPTLCEKCAVNRVPLREVHKNATQYQNPRMLDLDKYCYYKDWDTIYNIRTQVSDERPMLQIDKDLLLKTRDNDEPPRPKRLNHLATEADIYRFTDLKSSEARQVSLNNDYRYEYGLNMQFEQPRHYASEVINVQGYKPAQLIL